MALKAHAAHYTFTSKVAKRAGEHHTVTMCHTADNPTRHPHTVHDSAATPGRPTVILRDGSKLVDCRGSDLHDAADYGGRGMNATQAAAHHPLPIRNYLTSTHQV